MTPAFPELVVLARRGSSELANVPHKAILESAKDYVKTELGAIRERHRAGASGTDIVTSLTQLADKMTCGALELALTKIPNRRQVLQRVSLCAQGGYGRAQLNPSSDLDIGIIYDGRIDNAIATIDSFLSPFLFDIGYDNSVVVRSVKEAIGLAKRDTKVFTSYLECRLLFGSSLPYARLRLAIRDLRPSDTAGNFAEVKLRERSESLAPQFQDLYAPEPNVKDGAGGLRDYHAALWLLASAYGTPTLDAAVGQSLIAAEDRLELAEAIDFIWRVRNELHFRAGKANDKLSFAAQRDVARTFGYMGKDGDDTSRFMEDYYGVARKLRRFLRKVARTCDYEGFGLVATPRPEVPELIIEDGELFAGRGDPHWFEENPARLMSVHWECARRGVTLSHPTERLVEQNLHLVNDTFRSNDLVRRFFVALCNRPAQAGQALRQAAQVGLLGRYLPEFAAVQDVIRYADFHTYPVDEHTLRAVEALARVSELEGPVGDFLRHSLESLSDPYILVLALLFHDLGKAAGERHVDEGVRLTREICERIGMTKDDEERIAFLVEHHMDMYHNGIYRDTDDPDIVEKFAKKMKSDDRLRALLLLTYADLSAVGPNVWNDWKGALLLKLYLKTEKILAGRSETADEEFWKLPKAAAATELLPENLKPRMEKHLRDLGERYFAAFSPAHIALHVECLAEAEEKGLALRCLKHEDTGMSEVVVCTRDHAGVFAEIAGCFAAQLIDVSHAVLFTRPDGMTLDSFTVVNATRRRPLTNTQFSAVESALRQVLSGERTVEEYLEQSQRRLFGFMPVDTDVPTRVNFDNHSSNSHTVVDIESGDRTGLLYDIARVMTEQGLDIASARIVTDARRVRDSFYVTLNGAKLENKETQAAVANALRDAIHARPAVETKGGIS